MVSIGPASFAAGQAPDTPADPLDDALQAAEAQAGRAGVQCQLVVVHAAVEVRRHHAHPLAGAQLLMLAGLDAENWTPQFKYWTRPRKMDDGGQNLVD